MVERPRTGPRQGLGAFVLLLWGFGALPVFFISAIGGSLSSGPIWLFDEPLPVASAVVTAGFLSLAVWSVFAAVVCLAPGLALLPLTAALGWLGFGAWVVLSGGGMRLLAFAIVLVILTIPHRTLRFHWRGRPAVAER